LDVTTGRSWIRLTDDGTTAGAAARQDVPRRQNPGRTPRSPPLDGGTFVSIVRVGLSETKKFGDGYDAIFGKKKADRARQEKAPAAAKKTRKKATRAKKK
jgi:hypothetical protein